MKAYLILEDGNVFEGESVGANKEVVSEFVFNTSMTGYVEVLTDPSYAGQSVVMTYPLIGNYGVCLEDQESTKPYVEGFVVNELARLGSNFRKNIDLKDEAMALKKLLKPKIVKVKENKEKRPRKENSVYTGNIFGFDEYKEFICYARRFKYYFSLDGDGYREENSSGNKYHVKTKIKDNQVYSKVGSYEFLTAYIVYELFGKNAPDNYKIEFIDGNSKNVDISNLKCIPLEPEPDNKPIGLYLQNLNSISYDGEEDTPIMTFASKKEAAEYFKIPIKRFNDIFNSMGEIKVKIKSSPYYHYLRLLDTKK